MKAFSKGHVLCLALAIVGPSLFGIASKAPSVPNRSSDSVSKIGHIGTTGATVALAWSADGSTLATASNFGTTVAIWKANGDLIKQITGYGGGPLLQTDIGFIHGSREIVYPVLNAHDNTALFDVMDVASGAIIHRQTSSDGLASGQVFMRRASKIVVSQDQRLVAAIKFRSVLLFDTATWLQIREYPSPDRTGPSAIAFSRDGRKIAIGLTNGAAIVAPTSRLGEDRLYPGFSGRKDAMLSVGSIAFRPGEDELFIASGIGNVLPSALSNDVTNGTIQVINLQTGALAATLETNSPLVRSALWAKRGDAIWFVDGTRQLFRWSINKPETALASVYIDQTTLALAETPSGNELGVAGDSGVDIFEQN